MARAAAVCEGVGVVLVSAEDCSLGTGEAGLGGQAWVRAERGEGAERGRLDIGSMVREPGHPSLTSGSNERRLSEVKSIIYTKVRKVVKI